MTRDITLPLTLEVEVYASHLPEQGGSSDDWRPAESEFEVVVLDARVNGQPVPEEIRAEVFRWLNGVVRQEDVEE